MTKFKCFLCVLLLLSAACSPNNGGPEPTGQSDAQPIDLLITVNDLPAGWESVKPFKSPDNLCSVDCIFIQFMPGDGLVMAGEDIYVFRTAEDAKESYEKQVLPETIGKTPAEWDYVSKVADQSYFSCYTYQDMTNSTKCEWVGRYNRYVVEFSSYLIPGKMSLDDLKGVINTIDEKMQKVKTKPSS